MDIGPTTDLFAEPDKQPRPYVTFEMRVKETRDEDGKPVFTDVPWVKVTPSGSRDTLEKPADEWLQGLRAQAEAGRLPANWPHQYKEALTAWISGQEIPEFGTSIKNWPTLTAAQRVSVERAGLRTVEELALANDEAVTRIGMGGMQLRELAKSWVAEASGAGGLASKLQAAQIENEGLKDRTKVLEDQVAELMKLIPKDPKGDPPPAKPDGVIKLKE